MGSSERRLLHRVAKDGNVEQVSRLMRLYGADATLIDHGGDTPLPNASANESVMGCATLIAS